MCSTQHDIAGGYRVDAGTLARFSALRDTATRHAVDASEQAFPEIYAHFGPSGRQACLDDVALHLDFLRPVIETGDLAPFLAYLRWLSRSSGTGGVSSRSVPRSLRDLAAFFTHQLGDDAEPIVRALAAGEAALTEGGASIEDEPPGPQARPEATLYAAAALRGDGAAATRLLDTALDAAGSLPAAAVHVIHPAMVEVGRMWQENRASVQQEHLATAHTQTWMARAMAQALVAPANGMRAVFACMAGNRHALGLRMIADAFELDGWEVRYLGADTAPQDLHAAVHDLTPHLVGLSATLLQHLAGVRQAVVELRGMRAGACLRIVVGGQVFNRWPHLADWVGAELLGTDALAAVAAARAAGGAAA